MTFKEHLEILEKAGAQSFIEADLLEKKMNNFECLIFDWDGVFNDGMKMSPKGSPFSEPDSMGINILRFAYYLTHGKLPVVGIITGANNEGAKYFSARENLNFILRGFINKNLALEEIKTRFGIDPERAIFVWDDILDLPIADWAGLSIQVKRRQSVNLNDFAESNKLVDYRTSANGGQYAVREMTDLMSRALGSHKEAIQKRASFDESYQEYYANRKSCLTDEIKPA